MAHGQQGETSDDTLDILWTVGLIVVVVILAWYLGGTTITKYGLLFKRLQLMVVRWWYALWPAIQIKILGVNTSLTLDQITRELTFIQKNIGANLKFAEFNDILTYVGNFWRYPYTAFSLGMIGYLVFNRKSADNFRHVFNTATLRRSEQGNWPQITPVVKLDLVNTKLDDGPWAMARSPMNYCKLHNLLIVNKDERGEYNVKLDRNAATRLLEDQLGAKWQGVERLPMYAQALFAIFAARIADDRKSAEHLLDSLSLIHI